MSTPAEYITFLDQIGIKLWVENGQLRFHAKKGALTPEELSRIRSMRSEIIEELSQATAADIAQTPVSFQQRFCLKMLESYPVWTATLSYTFQLTGSLNHQALERSIECILQRHDSLRASVVHVRGGWQQQIPPGGRFHLPVVSASGDSDPEKRQNFHRLLQNFRAQELDRGVAPLMCAQLVRVSEREHFLVLLIHRLATDCLGVGYALGDLWKSYAKYTGEGALTDDRESFSYRDYTVWQHATDATWRQKHAAYWDNYLAGATPVSWPANLYTLSETPDASCRLASLESSFGDTVSTGLKSLSLQTQTLPALTVLTLYVTCLSLWCDQDDLLVPFIVAGRAAAHEGVVGCFAQVAYLRIRFKGNENFVELLKLISNEFYRAVAFRQDCGRMATERPELLQGTLCQWLSWHPADIAGLQLEDPQSMASLRVKPIRCQSADELSNAPPELVGIEINFFQVAGRIDALAIYRTDRFSDHAVGKLMQLLQSVAEHAVLNPHAPISGYPKIGQAEACQSIQAPKPSA